MSFVVRWLGLLAAAAGLLGVRGESPSTNAPAGRVVVLGDSLAAGYGVEVGEGWPEQLQMRIREAGLPFTVVNAGVSGDTTAGGLRRIDWVLRQPVDVLLIELGGNDGLRGISVANTRSNLVSMVRRTRQKWPRSSVVLAGMQMPPTMGAEYVDAFKDLFPDVARQEKVVLIPHLLEGVGGVPQLNQPDLIHPTAEGHQRLASNAWVTLGPLLRERTGR